nr:immunoglobulin heavy chain junction region [Macaca mulatta]MOW77778.1 immunoglobulin heavy chain junction region [Macaca mulatta]MOW79311.1 immunoglobulin heavy chain junction region [Macaca mulatta]MOW84680.1 immunoglobulin heavy chain junction region [Macaca mulatta]MOW85317.1 immunoglobulin heavy chain junction region [Macaca mulatta]
CARWSWRAGSLRGALDYW